MTPEEKKEALVKVVEKLDESELLELFIHVCFLKYRHDVEVRIIHRQKDLN